MKFTELQRILNSTLGIEKLADIARELDVTPQVVSNWKAKDSVPYKNVQILRKKLSKIREQNLSHKNIVNDRSPQEELFNVETSLIEIVMGQVSIIIKNYILFLSTITFVVTIAIIYLKFFAEPVYHSHAKILPSLDQSSKPSGIGNIAAQFGIGSMSGSESSLASSIMVPQIFKSRRLASELLSYKFIFSGQVDSINLASILGGKKVDVDTISQKQKYKLISKANKLIIVSENPSSPIIKISGKTSDGRFSKDIVDAALNQCKKIINEFKFKELEDKKAYIERRLSEISSELTFREEELKSFREKNRNIISSPSLLLEQARLLRDVELQNELYIRLKSEFELLQLEDVGGKDPIQILDFAEIPVKKTSPKPRELLVFSFICGIIIGLGCVLLKDRLEKNDFELIFNKNKFF